LTNEEQLIPQRILPLLPDDNEPIYVIAFVGRDYSTFGHEWAHCLYHTNPAYQDHVRVVWERDLTDKLRKVISLELEMRKYHRDKWLDEFQAYLYENPAEFGRKWKEALTPPHQALVRLLSPPPLLSNMSNPSKLDEMHTISNDLASLSLGSDLAVLRDVPDILQY